MSNPISHFVDLLDKWEYHYPLPSQWAVSIPLPTAINGSLESTIQSLEDKEWSIEESRQSLTKYQVTKIDGVHCFFVDSATLAGENFTVGSAKIGDGSNNGGLIQGLISNGRGDFASRTVNIAFRETAQSFADFIIRPWVILASHLGRIADRSEEIKANITVYNYGKSVGNNWPFVARKIYKYYGCIPSAVEAQELNYGGDSSIITYKTAWQFDRYSISDGEGPQASRAARENQKRGR